MKDYEAMILSCCQVKWRRTALGSDTSVAEVLGANFHFKSDTWPEKIKTKFVQVSSSSDESKSTSQDVINTYHRQYMMALLYFSSEILSESLKRRAVRLKQIMEAESKMATWADLCILMKKYMKSMDSRFILRELICFKRQDGDALLDWIQSFASHRQLLAKSGVELPESLWVDWIWAQMSPMERRIVTRRGTISEFESVAAEFVLEDLPVYRSSLCAQEVGRLPIIPTSRAKAKEKKQKNRPNQKPNEKKTDNKPSSGQTYKYCGYCKTRNPDHKFEDCPKLLRRKARESKESDAEPTSSSSSMNKKNPKQPDAPKKPSTRPIREAAVKGERRRRGLYLVCGEAGHFANDCPQKAKGFVGSIQTIKARWREQVFPTGNVGIMKAQVNFLVNGKYRKGIVGLDTCCSTTIVSDFTVALDRSRSTLL